MNINLTLFAQMVSFAFFVWFCMRFVWPPLVHALETRKKTIADGLAAAERGIRERELAEQHAKEVLKTARHKEAEIIAQAQRRAGEIIEEAKADARGERDRLLAAAQAEREQEINRAREHLRAEVAALALSGAERLLKREIDPRAHEDLLNELAAEIPLARP